METANTFTMFDTSLQSCDVAAQKKKLICTPWHWCKHLLYTNRTGVWNPNCSEDQMRT